MVPTATLDLSISSKGSSVAMSSQWMNKVENSEGSLSIRLVDEANRHFCQKAGVSSRTGQAG